jgi:hypothetical protein
MQVFTFYAMRGYLFIVLVSIGARASQAQRAPESAVVPTPGTLFLLRAMRSAGTSVVDSFPKVGQVCDRSPRFIVRSGWLVLRGQWWVVVDSVATCEGAPVPAYSVRARVDSGVTAGRAGRLEVLMLRGTASPLPGPGAVLRWAPRRDNPLRIADTVTLAGVDTSITLVYVAAPLH